MCGAVITSALSPVLVMSPALVNMATPLRTASTETPNAKASVVAVPRQWLDCATKIASDAVSVASCDVLSR